MIRSFFCTQGVMMFGTLSGMLSNMAFGVKGASEEYETQMVRPALGSRAVGSVGLF